MHLSAKTIIYSYANCCQFKLINQLSLKQSHQLQRTPTYDYSETTATELNESHFQIRDSGIAA